MRSLLLKNYDYLLAPDNEQLDKLGAMSLGVSTSKSCGGLRESMLFAPELRDEGERFVVCSFKLFSHVFHGFSTWFLHS